MKPEIRKTSRNLAASSAKMLGSPQKAEKNTDKIKSIVSLSAGVIIMFVFILFAIAPSAFAPYGEKDMASPWQPPSGEHILGTNDMGYDVFTELVYATRLTLIVGVSSALIALLLGTLIGILAGYGGIIGSIFNGLINIFLMLPKTPVIIVLAAFLGGGSAQIILIISAFSWVGTARAVRAKTVHIKSAPYLSALKCAGYSPLRIILRHVLPNVREVAVARYITTVSSSIMTEATLSFLGLGDPTNPTWGTMINFAYNRGGFMMEAYGALLAPGAAIMLLVLAFYMINRYFETKTNVISGKSYLD